VSGRVVGHVLRSSQSAGAARLVMVAIAERADDDGAEAWPSLDTIAHDARIDRATVKRALLRLEAAGELVIIRGGGRRTNHYVIPGVPRSRTAPPQPIHQLVIPLDQLRPGGRVVRPLGAHGAPPAGAWRAPNRPLTVSREPSSRARKVRDDRGQTGLRSIAGTTRRLVAELGG